MGENADPNARATWSPASLALAVLATICLAGELDAAGLVGTRAASRVTLATDISATAARLETNPESTRNSFSTCRRPSRRMPFRSHVPIGSSSICPRLRSTLLR